MKRYIFTFLSILCSSNALSLSLEQQRTIYSEAHLLQQQNKWDKAEEKISTIPIYPLTYLLQYEKIKSDFSQNSLPEVSSFIANNKGHQVSNDLQRSYLYYLAEEKNWFDFLTFYPQLPRSNKLKCLYFQAKMETGAEKEIFPEVRNTWLTGYSQPNACDSVFDYYLENDQISSELIWQRFELAYASGKKGLMSYLITMMEGDNRKVAKQLYTLHNKPKSLNRSKLFKHRDQISYPFLKDAIKRLAKVDIQSGVQAYTTFEQKMPFTFNDEVALKKYLSSRVLIKNEKELLPWVDKNLPYLGDVKLIEQRIRYAIKYSNWSEIEYWITQLPPDISTETTWVYWQARVLENKKQFKNADKLYNKIAGERKYYGFLAAQKLGLSYELNADIVVPKTTSLRYVQAQLDHIEELAYHQYSSLVKREWESLLKGRDVDIQRQLGLYAYDQGWAHLAVVASVRSKSWDALNIRFPEVNPALFLENSQKYQVAPSYIYAITRQESSFDQYANSPVGATGYMQLMPQTAKETARKIGLKNYKKKAQLTEGKINVQLGTAYFDSLLKRYEGNRILATAAYNAGPNRVDRWKKNSKGRDNQALSMDSWVESIPYKETRRYVKNVLSYNVIYQHILDKPMEFFNATERNAFY